jgi:hypothetical protein
MIARLNPIPNHQFLIPSIHYPPPTIHFLTAFPWCSARHADADRILRRLAMLGR